MRSVYNFLAAMLILSVIPAVPAFAVTGGEYRNSIKWQEYQSRRAERKTYARHTNAASRHGRNYSRVQLSHRVNVNPAMPFGHPYNIPQAYRYPRIVRRPVIVVGY